MRYSDMPGPISYALPTDWIRYDLRTVMGPLTEAKASVMSLASVPYQRAWAERLQEIQLKSEVAGTSRIEGAEFTDNELDAALNESVDRSGLTRSQRQARSAVETYRWIAKLESDRPINAELVREVHRRIITGCDDDHCPPGQLRAHDQNVTFGNPRHRGALGGDECAAAFSSLMDAWDKQFKDHDILIRALAFHYHFGAMHPFLDGNGRTARAVEALMLQRSGLKQTLFIALSNYYHDEKPEYLRCLAHVRANGGDMTQFLVFGLNGITQQCKRLLREININISKVLFRDVATDLFGRLENDRKRVIAKRQIALLNFLLDRGETDVNVIFRTLYSNFNMKEPWLAFVRDMSSLQNLNAVWIRRDENAEGRPPLVDVRLDWPTKITETKFFQNVKSLPRAKTLQFLRADYGPQPKGAGET